MHTNYIYDKVQSSEKQKKIKLIIKILLCEEGDETEHNFNNFVNEF